MTHRELADRFDLDEVLMVGSLPPVFALSPADRISFLRAYALTYLKEEIAAEQILRKLDPFRNFLEIAAQLNGNVLNFSKTARLVGVDYKTVQAYYEVLEDTLVGFLLPPFHESIRRRQSQHAKFFFFDLGVKRALDRTLEQSLGPRSYGYGFAFEHFVIAELRRLADYANKDWRWSYLRTAHGVEVDLVIERPGEPRVLMEIKSAERVDEADVASLARLHHDSPDGTQAFCVCRGSVAKRIGKVACLPWRQIFAELGL